MMLMGPVIPCESKDCWAIPRVDLQVSGTHIAWVCPKHEWEMMRKIRNSRRYDLEYEKGWQNYCQSRGYDSLATTFTGAMRNAPNPIQFGEYPNVSNP